MEIYCLRCKEKTITKAPKKVIMGNGMNAVQGTCSDCGCKVSVITGKSNKAVAMNSSKEIHKNQMEAAKSLLRLRQYGRGRGRDWLEGYIAAQEAALNFPSACLNAEEIDEAASTYEEHGAKSR